MKDYKAKSKPASNKDVNTKIKTQALSKTSFSRRVTIIYFLVMLALIIIGAMVLANNGTPN